jgi:hypothetical protein
MKTKPPPDRRKFANDWDEIGYLYDKLLFWLYARAESKKARRYAERLARRLAQADPHHEAIFAAECWSLVHEAKGDLPEGIKHRENEIRLIRKLQAAAHGKSYERIALQGYGYEDLSDRLDLLAALYGANGDLEQAVSALQASKRLCEEHGLPFDGQDMLVEYMKESKADFPSSRTVSRIRRR